jgi:hypothetical protein
MKVFISSVRRGLEEERDALPALITALGFEPLHFENFTAQPWSSREACVRAVGQADVYLLLIGPAYGEPMPDTGLSATHEEYNAARAKGIPVLVFRKEGVVLAEDQAKFVAEVEAYPTGHFRQTFSSAPDLLAKVAAALRALPEPGKSSDWSPLSVPVEVEWRDQWPRGSGSINQQASLGAEVELHAVPLEPARYSRRQLGDAAESMARHLRSGLVPAAMAMNVGSDHSAAWVLPAPMPGTGGFDRARPEELLGVRLSSAGQRSAWMRLPSDSMGSMLDGTELAHRISRLLRILGGMVPAPEMSWGLAVGLLPSFTLSVGSEASLGARSSAQVLGRQPRVIHVEPDEAASSDALGTSSEEVGAVAARNLINAFTNCS